MNAQQLKRRLKGIKENMPETHAIRLHRAISWLQCAENNKEDFDIQFISLWIAFNACYAAPLDKEYTGTEKERFGNFLVQLIALDEEKRFYNLLWNKFSTTVRLLLENQYVFKPFWDFQRGEIKVWKPQYDKSYKDCMKYLSKGQVVELLEVVLDRLYTLRNQLMHGGATYKSKVNREQMKQGCAMLQLMICMMIEIMLNNAGEDWGGINYPVVG